MSEEELYKLLNIPYKPWIELTNEEIQLFEKNNNYIKQLQQENSQLKQQLKETNNCLNLQISNVILLEKELKDKDEKISKIEKLTKQLKGSARYQRCMDELDYILNIIKED